MEQGEARRRTLYLAVVGLAVLYLAYLARDAVVPLFIALILAYLLSPLVAALERRGVSRIWAVCLLFTAFFGSTGTALFFGVPPLLGQGRSLVLKSLGEPSLTVGVALPPAARAFVAGPSAPPLLEYLDSPARGRTRGAPPLDPEAEGNWERQETDALRTGGEEAVAALRRRHETWRVTLHRDRAVAFNDWDHDGRLDAGYLLDGTLQAGTYVRERLKAPGVATAVEEIGTGFLPKMTESLLSADVARTAFGVLGTVFQMLAWTVIVPLYTFFFLLKLGSVWEWFVGTLPGSHRERVVKVLHQIHRMLIGFFRGRVLTMAAKGLIIGIGLAIVGAPSPMLFGVAAGLLTIIPVVGPLGAAVPVVVLSYRQGGVLDASLAAGVMLAGEILEGYVLIPRMVGKEVGLHPMAVITAILVGGALLGMFGVVIAIPLAAAAKIVWEEFVLPAIRAKAAEAPRPPPGA